MHDAVGWAKAPSRKLSAWAKSLGAVPTPQEIWLAICQPTTPRKAGRAGPSRSGFALRRCRGRELSGDFHCRDAVLHRLLHFLECTHLDLANALARDPELVGQLLERDRLVDEAPPLEDAPLPMVERCNFELPTRRAEVLLFQRQRSCYRQARPPNN